MSTSPYHEQVLHNVLRDAVGHRDMWIELADPLDKTIAPGELFDVQARTYIHVIDSILASLAQGVPAETILRETLKSASARLHLLDRGELTPDLNWNQREGEYMALDTVRKAIKSERQKGLPPTKA